MEGKISDFGVLHIKRGNSWIEAYCVSGSVSGDFVKCDHNCALFGEPDKSSFPVTCLSLCHKTLTFDKFTDERN